MKKQLVLGILALSTLNAFATDPVLYCYEKANPAARYDMDDELESGSGKCDDSLNSESIAYSYYGVCYTGKTKDFRQALAEDENKIEYRYKNDHTVIAVLSEHDNPKSSTIKMQNMVQRTSKKRQRGSIDILIEPCSKVAKEN